eukprot:scaffold48493_cov20-Tisochrysis_lutea.AAC.2
MGGLHAQPKDVCVLRIQGCRSCCRVDKPTCTFEFGRPECIATSRPLAVLLSAVTMPLPWLLATEPHASSCTASLPQQQQQLQVHVCACPWITLMHMLTQARSSSAIFPLYQRDEMLQALPPAKPLPCGDIQVYPAEDEMGFPPWSQDFIIDGGPGDPVADRGRPGWMAPLPRME